MTTKARSQTHRFIAGTLGAILALSLAAGAQERDRSKIPDALKWNLSDIYASDAAWRGAKDAFAAEMPTLGRFKGRLTSSAGAMADGLDRMFALDKELSRLYVYASMEADQDTRDSQHQGMRQEMTQLAANFSAQASFVEPEVLKAGKAAIEKYLAAEPRLKVYRVYLEDILRREAHTLTDNEEKLLADAGPLASGPSSTFNILSNADFPYPTVRLSDGRSVKIDQAAYNDLRA